MTITRHLKHLESMRDLKPGERVESITTPDGPGLMQGTVVKRAPVKRDGWIVKWDNGRQARIATSNIRRVSA